MSFHFFLKNTLGGSLLFYLDVSEDFILASDNLSNKIN